MANKTKNLQWGSANRPKVSNKLGAPDPREGGDGDIQIRQSVLGAKLFGRIGSDWYETPLGINGKTKFGTSISNYLSIDHNSVDIFANNTKVASFGATTTVGNLNSSAGGDITVDNISLNGRITLNSSTGTTTLGASNIMIGTDALTNPSGTASQCEQNIAIGHTALEDLTGGAGAGASISNIGIGVGTAKDLSTGSSNNIAIGTNAMRDTATAVGNIAIGTFALGAGASTPDYNVAIGYSAGNNVTSGDNNIFIGKDAGKTGSPGGQITTASNKMVLGDENIDESHIQTDWTVASDKRDKTDISNLSLGLEFINKLTPVTYKWDKRVKYIDKDDSSIDLNSVSTDGTHKEDWLDVGFLAQDIEVVENSYNHKVSDKTNLTFSVSEDGKQYGSKYTKFIPILTKAVQELSAQVDAMQIEINNLK